MPFISVDATTETILLLAVVLTPIPLGFLFLLWNRSRKQLGRAFPRKLLAVMLMPSGVYNALNMRASKDTLDSDSYEDISLARSKTIYKPKKGGGPNLAIVDPISDSTLNARYINYIQQMKEGKNKECLKFDSREEAYFHYYENTFLPTYKGATPEWITEEQQKVKAAKGILARRMQRERKTTVTDSTPEGNITQTDQKETETILLNPMTDAEYDDIVAAIERRLVEESAPIFPIAIDHDIVTLNDIAKWEHRPVPIVVTMSQYERGKLLERKKQHADAVKILILGIVATILMIGLSVAYKIFTK